MKEFTLTKRQRRSVMMLTGGEQHQQQLLLDFNGISDLVDKGSKSARNAWPAFVPAEMAERFLNENTQVEKVTNAELEPILEEGGNR